MNTRKFKDIVKWFIISLILIANIRTVIATTTQIFVDMDAWIESSSPNGPGNEWGEQLLIQSSEDTRVIFRVNASSIPEDAIVTEAIFAANCYDHCDAYDDWWLSIHRVEHSTPNKEASWIDTEVGWNIYKTGSYWTNPGGDFASASDNISVSSNGWKKWNVTNDFSNLSESGGLRSWIVRGPEGPHWEYMYLYSMDTDPAYVNITYTQADNNPPWYTTNTDDSSGSVSEGKTVNVSVYWKDNLALDTAIFRHNASGTWQNISTCSFTNNESWCNKTIDTTGLADKTVCWNMFANDTAGNMNSSMSAHCFVVNEFTPPLVKMVTITPKRVLNGTKINITANVTDNNGISAVKAMLYYPNGTSWQNITMTDTNSDDIYNCSVTVEFYPHGSYNITIWANDTFNNINNTEKSWFAPYLNLSKSANIAVNGIFTDWVGVKNVTDLTGDSGGSSSSTKANVSYYNSPDIIMEQIRAPEPLSVGQANTVSVVINVTTGNGTTGFNWSVNVSLWNVTKVRTLNISNWNSTYNEASYVVYTVMTADMDLDGDLDIIAGDYNGRVYIFENPGNSINISTWDKTYGTTSDRVRDIVVVDIDNDGDIDIIAGDYNGRVYIFENPGNSINISTWDKTYGTTSGVVYALATADLDNDGDNDIVSGGVDGSVYIWKNPNNSANISEWNKTYESGTSAVYGLATADIDNDGDSDIISGTDNKEVTIWENPSNSMNISNWNKNLAYAEGSVMAVVVADLDNDGDIDIVSGDYDSYVFVFENPGNSVDISTWTKTNATASGYVYALGVGDLDNDGDNDIVSGDWGTPQKVYVWENPGNSINIANWNYTTISGNGDFRESPIADIDGDGDEDIITGDDASRVTIWENPDVHSTYITSDVKTFINETKNATTYTLSWTPAATGNYTLMAVADNWGRCAEVLENNNKIVMEVNVSSTGNGKGFDIKTVSLANDATYLFALMKINGSIDYSDPAQHYRLFISVNALTGSNYAPDTSTGLPIKFDYMIESYNATLWRVYNASDKNIANVSAANNSNSIEVAIPLANLSLSTNDVINVTFETSSDSKHFDMAPDNASFLSYTIAEPEGDVTKPWYTQNFDNTTGWATPGTLVNVHVLWEDNSALDTAIFRHNASGTWQNVSTCTLSNDKAWCNKTINTTGRAAYRICWNMFANDTAGNMNSSMPAHCFVVGNKVTTQIFVDMDAYITSSSPNGPGNEWGEQLLIQSSEDTRVIFRVNASSIPEDAIVTEAIFAANCYDHCDAYDDWWLSLHRVEHSTPNKEASWIDTEVGWNIYKTGSYWTNPGGDFASASDNISVSSNGWKKWNVTNDFSNLSESGGLRSWIVRGPEGPDWEYMYLYSMDTDPAYVNITYLDTNPDIGINSLSMSNTELLQGDRFNLTVNVNVINPLENLTARFIVVNSSGDAVVYIETDFFDVSAGDNQNLTFEFKWTDFSSERTGELNISTVSIKHYTGDFSSPVVKSTYPANKQFNVTQVTDPILKKFIARENSLWWLTEMGWVNSSLTNKNNFDYCVMYGGDVTGELTNEEYYVDGSDVKCYWEITGYAVRALALEYERTKNTEIRDLAKKMANAIVSNLNNGSVHPQNNGTIHTQDYFNGTEVKEYKDQAIIFDHGQIQMGLLELGRVMEKMGDTGYQTYKDEGERVGRFLYFTYKNNSDVLPQLWYRNNLTIGKFNATGTKEIIGMRYLYENTGNQSYMDMAKSEYNRISKNDPSSGGDFHGKSYVAYGFIKGFEWFNNKSYLDEASKWAINVSNAMDANGMLNPEEYSRIPTQSQIVRNNVLIWKYTANETFITWADKSADYLTSTDDIWVYNQTILKLGKYYRESGGQYNNQNQPELTSWGTEFHIDAFYHYLHHRYGDIYIDVQNQRHISMITPPNISFGADEINVTVNGTNDNLGIYINSQNNIKEVYLGNKRVYYFTNHTARVYPYSGSEKIRVVLGNPVTTHIMTTNSNITNTTYISASEFFIEFNGLNKTNGTMTVYWNTTKPASIELDGTPLMENVSWEWNATSSEIKIKYPHSKHNLTINSESQCDLVVTSQNITFSDSTPIEGESITIYANITNLGSENANNVTVQFLDDGTTISNKTINISKYSTETTSVNWTAQIGPNEITVVIDPVDAINETNESNNNASKNISISAYHVFYKGTSGSLKLGSGSKVLKDFGGYVVNIFITDPKSNVNFNTLQAIGRNISGGVSSNDFTEIDATLGMTGFNDSISSLFSIDGTTPKNVKTFEIFGTKVYNVPIINSTTTGPFTTGILWDTSDDTNGEYDNEKEDLVFITENNETQSTPYGIADYVTKVPALLRAYKGEGTTIEFFLEVN